MIIFVFSLCTFLCSCLLFQIPAKSINLHNDKHYTLSPICTTFKLLYPKLQLAVHVISTLGPKPAHRLYCRRAFSVRTFLDISLELRWRQLLSKDLSFPTQCLVVKYVNLFCVCSGIMCNVIYYYYFISLRYNHCGCTFYTVLLDMYRNLQNPVFLTTETAETVRFGILYLYSLCRVWK